MGDFRFVKSTMSVTPEFEQRLLGGAVEEGDILAWTAGELLKAADDEAKTSLFLAMEDGADAATITVMRITRDTIIEGTQTGTIGVVGDAMGLNLTSTVLTFDPAATAANEHFEVYRIVDATAKTIQCRFIG